MTTPTSCDAQTSCAAQTSCDAEMQKQGEMQALAQKQAELEAMFNVLNLRVDAMQPALRIDTVICDDVAAEPVEKVEKVEKKRSKSAKKKVVDTPAFALPWNGTPIPGCCNGIRANYDTFTQCVNATIKDGDYCKTCSKNCGESGIPKDGNVDTRATTDKKIKPYIHYMNAKKLSKQQVIDEAAKFNVDLDASVFEKPAPAKGRPKKQVSVDSDEDDTAEVQIIGLLKPEPSSPSSP